MSNFKAVIFDLDGTLLNTIDDLMDSVNYVLSGKGFPTHDSEKYKYFIGDGMANLVRRALPQNIQDDALVEDCFLAARDEYRRRWADKSKPYNGIPELLDRLTQAGIKMSVLSNKPDEFTKLIMNELFPRWKFEIVFGERNGIPRKPNPSGALEISSQLQINPQEFLYLGDTNTDMMTANAAGMYAVGVLWGFRKADELLESGAKTLIDKPLDLVKML
ncbi:MAG: HAD-superfamily hydrolase, subfamily variant 3 [Clostridiales bacterium]|jgi:phosphoglycolate phosphatase|nr:HAD-superfamily hydrolase, subfamily variant 3 [Clostridiales bacterium]